MIGIFFWLMIIQPLYWIFRSKMSHEERDIFRLGCGVLGVGINMGGQISAIAPTLFTWCGIVGYSIMALGGGVGLLFNPRYRALPPANAQRELPPHPTNH